MFNFALSPHSRKADTIPVSLELFNQMLDSLIVAQTCQRISDQSLGLASPDKSIRELAQKHVSELKATLPAFCWHATFKNSKRKNHEAIPSGLAIMDYDHIDNPEAIFNSIKDQALALNLVAAHITPSCAGLRLVFAMPDDTRISDFQAFVAQRLNIPGFDSCVHDLARISFVVPRSYWLYIDEDALFGNNPMTLKPIDMPKSQKSSQRISRSRKPESSTKADHKDYDKTYKGIPYEKIVEQLEYFHGGKPMHSVRNMTIFAMACCIRQICNNDPDWVASILPDYGEDHNKWYSTIRSACNRPLPEQLQPRLVKAIECARNTMAISKNIGTPKVNIISADTPPEMPAELPDLVAHLIKNVPAVCRPAVSHGIFPSLATHLHGVRFRLIDGSEKEPTFICIDMARQSSGKSAVNKPIQYITADIRERDEINRRREQEWKDICNANKNGKKDNPPRPAGLVV